MNRNNIPRLFIDKELKKNIKLKLDKADQHYLKTVLRLLKGDKVKIFNGRSGEWEAVIDNTRGAILVCSHKIKEQKIEDGPSLYFSLIKNNSLKWMIEKATELGVSKLYPIITERSNNKYFNAKKALIHIKEACEVSERLTVPVLEKVNTLDKILEQTKKNSDSLIFCNETRKDKFLQHYLSKKKKKKISFLIGPEGGFSIQEEENIKSYKHVISVKLFNRLIRAETAAIMALSIFNSYKKI